jgi:predicted acyltransferase
MRRLASLDFMRGLIMVLLALESTALSEHFFKASENTVLNSFFLQFFHHPWNGLRFWDLIQPAFMFMAGIAMAYSLHHQKQKGITWNSSFIKVVKRSGWLFFWGVLDYAVRPGGLSFELWDVLTQLSFTTVVAFLIFEFSALFQISCSIGLLLLTEYLYRGTHITGFDMPFVDQHNFGNYMDTVLMHKINAGGWVAINCIPTAVHTITGALVGKLLLGTETKIEKENINQKEIANKEITNKEEGLLKIKIILIFAMACLVLGYGLDYLGVTPIIKRIATSSFTLASLGWCIMCLAICYWWIDILDHKKYLLFFTIVGMNSLFIYLFFEIIGARWFNEYITQMSTGLLNMLHLPIIIVQVGSSLTIFALEWSICYFLYKKKIFFKI